LYTNESAFATINTGAANAQVRGGGTLKLTY
jgi:hypothetical protein